MWLFGRREKAATGQPHYGAGSGWRTIMEPYAGAFQKNDSLAMPDATSYPALYAAINRIASDIGALDFKIMAKGSDGVARAVPKSRVVELLARPNHFQTSIQFRRAWVISLLTAGNTIVLKADNELFILDWERIQPLVSTSGGVFYKISSGKRSLLPAAYNGQEITVPASSIIHDRINCFVHELVGIAPVSAALLATTKNTRILEAANEQFSNGGQMGGIIAAPAGISDEQAKELREQWKNTKPNSIRVLGMDAKYTPFTQKSTDAQAVEQLQYSDRQIAQAFGVPPYLIGIVDFPSGLQPAQVMSMFFRTTLQPYVSAMEELLTDGLNLPSGQHIKLDTDQLLRLDTQARGDYLTTMVKGGVMTRNEARAQLDLPKVDGADELHVQQQDIPLSEVGNDR